MPHILHEPHPDADIAIGIMAHNEEGNIGHLLDGVVRQSVDARIRRVIVMADGCTDRTCDIVTEHAAADQRIELVARSERHGKVDAINRFIKMVDQPLCIVTSADLAFHPSMVERLTAPFADPRIGVVGARAVPINTPETFVGFTINLMWTLHHDVSLIEPKMGEICAFRNVIDGLDPMTLNDESAVQHEIALRGYRAAYAPEALFQNCGPGNLRDFVEQRTRWIVANLSVQRDYNMSVPTMKSRHVLPATLKYLRRDWRRAHWFAGAALVELYARVRARAEFAAIGRRHGKFHVWKPIATTKTIAEKKL
ncbi:MAG TPA: glycosyltransferase [Candidatus Eremiobacteraceae bacterium]|nr:glycosyltransferase [Candidatus Eremiobacteraceae bacterium]